jgi:death-on-curing protein
MVMTMLENIAVWVADNIIGKDLLKELIASLIYEDEFSEGLKLALIEAADEFGGREQ